MKYKIVSSVDELPAFDKALPLFSDIETEGLYVGFRMVQFYQPETTPDVYIVDIAQMGYELIEYATQLSKIKRYIMNRWTVWFNASYDLGTLNISPMMNDQPVDDLFYLMKSAYPSFMDFGLKKVVRKFPETRDLYANVDEKAGAKGFTRGAYISADDYEYAALDVYSMKILWDDARVQKIREFNLAYKVDMISQKYALIYQQTGLLVHEPSRTKELKQSYIDREKYTELLPADFNPNSWQQVRKLLGIKKSAYEDLVAYLNSDADDAALAEYIIKLKRAKKQIGYLEGLAPTMYTKFNVAGAITGRFTAAGGDLPDGFNGQQIPRNYQYMFNKATEDTVVVHADYSTLELRLAATIFKDAGMYQLFKDGKDPHAETASDISKKPVHPDGAIYIGEYDEDNPDWVTSVDRQNAKAPNFGFVFGMSANTFIPYAFTNYNQKYTVDEANEVRAAYFRKYVGVGRHHKYVWDHYKKPSFIVETALGRRVKPKLGTDGINTPVQGSGAETTKLAIHYLVRDYGEEVLQYIYLTVHDAIYLRVPRGEELHWGEALEKSMLLAWTEISKTDLFFYKDIPMIAEVEYELEYEEPA